MFRNFFILLLFILPNILLAQDYQKETAPIPLNLNKIRAMIQYPDSARINKIEGRIIVKILLDANGNVEKISDEIQGPEIFHEEVKRVTWNLKFTPAKQDDIPVKCWVSIPFNFQLSKPPEDEK